ncbi:hypothetical protein ACWEFL_27625 [Streptomyces sp. NPDC004838]
MVIIKGRMNRMVDCYEYRIVTSRGDLTLIWRRGEDDALDRLALDDRGRLLTFPDRESARRYCEDQGRRLVRDDEPPLDLVAVGRWAEQSGPGPYAGPDAGPVSAGLVLDAWNFFEDLARSLKADPPLPPRGPLSESAYEKIFGGSALDPDGGAGAWTADETEAVRVLLRAGLELWRQAVPDAPLTGPASP